MFHYPNLNTESFKDQLKRIEKHKLNQKKAKARHLGERVHLLFEFLEQTSELKASEKQLIKDEFLNAVRKHLKSI